MKKFLSLFLTLFILLSFAACGEGEDNVLENNSGVSSENGDIENDKVADDNGKITVEKVKNAPETSADDFTTVLVDGGISIDRYTGEDEIVVIPEKIDGMPVVEIGNSCFVNNEKIKGVKISDAVETINSMSFLNCYSLEIFISGKNVKTIGSYAFNYCTSLKVVALNDGLQSLQYGCFIETNQLEEVFVPTSVSEIDTPFVQFSDNVTIITEAGSAAETYAKENGIKYEIR